jgi:hypothetical protein
MSDFAELIVDPELMRLDAGSNRPRLLLTDAWLIERQAVVADRRLADP